MGAYRSLKFFLISLLLFLVAACSPQQQAATALSSPVPLEQPTEVVALEPDQVVEAFYRWYLSLQGSPLSDRLYANSPYLSPNMIAHLDRMLLDQKNQLSADPILLTQAEPTSIQAETIREDGQTARVLLNESGPLSKGVDLTIDLVKENGEWKIDALQRGNPTTADGVVRLFFNAYLNAVRNTDPEAGLAYRSNPYLSPAYVQRLDAQQLDTSNKTQPANFDPLLLSRELPLFCTPYSPELTVNLASVVVECTWQALVNSNEVSFLKFFLIPDGDGWLIDNIAAYQPPDSEDVQVIEVPSEGAEVDTFTDSDYGYSLPYPKGWAFEDPNAGLPRELQPGGVILKQYLLAPQNVLNETKMRQEANVPPELTGPAPSIPFRIDILSGGLAALDEIYSIANYAEEVEFNGYSAVYRQMNNGQWNQYVFPHPDNPDLLIVFTDMVTQDPHSGTEGKALVGLLESMLDGIEFGR